MSDRLFELQSTRKADERFLSHRETHELPRLQEQEIERLKTELEDTSSMLRHVKEMRVTQCTYDKSISNILRRAGSEVVEEELLRMCTESRRRAMELEATVDQYIAALAAGGGDE